VIRITMRIQEFLPPQYMDNAELYFGRVQRPWWRNAHCECFLL